MVGLELINGTNEDVHIMDSIKLIVVTMAKMYSEGSLNLDETPASCKKRRSDPAWAGGKDILK